MQENFLYSNQHYVYTTMVCLGYIDTSNSLHCIQHYVYTRVVCLGYIDTNNSLHSIQHYVYTTVICLGYIDSSTSLHSIQQYVYTNSGLSRVHRHKYLSPQYSTACLHQQYCIRNCRKRKHLRQSIL